MADISGEFLKEHKQFRIKNKKLYLIFFVSAVLVAVIVFWWLKLVGITISSDAFCGKEEHVHSVECYSVETESESVTAEDSSVSTQDDEYLRQVLICTKTEHTHSSACFPNSSADKETVSDWLKTFENITITNDIKKNLIAIATTQMGYEESEKNFDYDSEGNVNGYTRYGEWYGNPYGKWNVMFVSFCLHYSNINNVSELESAGAEAMMIAWKDRNAYASAEKYSPERGDIVFYDTNGDDVPDNVAIILSVDKKNLTVVCGDSNNKVEVSKIPVSDSITGYGLAGKLSFAEDKEYFEEVSEAEETSETEEIIAIQAAPLRLYNSTRANITYINELDEALKAVTFKTLEGEIIDNNSTIYIGQTYVITMEFAEKNTGDEWIQFRHDEDHHLHYQIPENIEFEPFLDPHPITAKTENGTIEEVGSYYLREDGLLVVIFEDDPVTGECFGSKYSNVDFTIQFNATVGHIEGENTTKVEFNDKVKVEFAVDGGAGMKVSKTHSEYNGDDNTVEFTVKVEATHGVVSDLVIDDQIWVNHYTLRDTIIVTDLDGNVIDPQPVISNHPHHDTGTQGGFRLTDFPEFSAGNGFLIKYKTSIYDHLLGGEYVDVWNGIDAYGKDYNGDDLYIWAEDWEKIELEKMSKGGKQTVLEDAQGNPISVIEWDVGIRKHNNNLHGTVVIDTLGTGLEYYTQQPIYIARYDEWGNRLPDVHIDWNDVTINGNSMSFELPDGFAFDIIYYTTYEELDEGEQKEFNNSVSATINGKHEQAGGTADVVGFIPHVSKSAYGDDGKYAYFTIEADVPAVISNWGHFYLTDMAAFWGYNNGAGLYVENKPEDFVVTALTASGKTITFTPYVAGGPIENTYTLISPANGNEEHSFNVLFNTSETTFASSKWMLDEDAKLIITYKIPFDAKTGTEWSGELTGDKTLKDVLLEGNQLANEAYLNYTEVIRGVDAAMYKYSPLLLKDSEINENGEIDYSVVFHSTIPGSGGNTGYLNGVDMAWFTDTFDEKLEYVDGTLTVTCYDPWKSDRWLTKYTYNGPITGNSIYVSADKFVLSEVNSAVSGTNWNTDWLATLDTYYKYYHNMAGGDHVFTYTLKVKDEYRYSTEFSRYKLSNTAELKWDADGTSGPASDEVIYETGLVDKQVVQKDNKLNFEIHINKYALDILKGVDTLTIEDTMTENLSVYWDTIKLYYEDADGNWIAFEDSDEYEHTVTYDAITNTLKFTVPDELHIKVDYTTLITQSGTVSVSNSVTINASAQVSDIVDATFKVVDHSGDATGSNHNITLLKQDGISKVPLPDAKFLLYGPMGDSSAVLPDGAEETITTANGKTLKYIGAYTTGADGTVNIETQYLTVGGPYALVETKAPDGYELMTTPTYFYFYDVDPNGIIQSVTTIIAVENFNGSFIFPETGGSGTLHLTILGFALTASPVLYSIIRRKRERRFS